MSDRFVFKPCAGAAIVKRADCAAIMQFQIGKPEDGLSAGSLIVTGMTLEMSGNYQILHTVGSLIYFYSFGDRIGTLNVTGIGFVGACDEAKKFDIGATYQKYNAMKAVKKGGEAISVVLNSGGGQQIKLWGFLTGFRADIADSQMGTVGYWSMRFEVAPDTSGGFDGFSGDINSGSAAGQA